MINLEEIKQKLLKEREELKLMLETINKESKEVLMETVFSSDEIADRYEYKEEAHILKESLQERLTKIENALKRIEEGNYFFCQKCGREIEESRLKIDPAIDLCRECSLK